MQRVYACLTSWTHVWSERPLLKVWELTLAAPLFHSAVYGFLVGTNSDG